MLHGGATVGTVKGPPPFFGGGPVVIVWGRGARGVGFVRVGGGARPWGFALRPLIGLRPRPQAPDGLRGGNASPPGKGNPRRNASPRGRELRYRNARFTTLNAPAATSAAAGIVMNQPMTMFLATPQRTAFTRFVAPTPMIAEVMTWVVETGALKR